jgi:mannonate dehydratase
VIKIAMSLSASQPGPLWTLMRQCGVEAAVGGIGLRPVPDAPPDEQPWSQASLARAKTAYEAGGIPLAVIESRPPMDKIKLGLPGKEEQLEVVCELIRSMGALDIPVWCYDWMPILGVLRTSRTIPTRGGAHVSGYDLDQMEESGPTEFGTVTEEHQWACLKEFLEHVVPIAEEANVKLALHPDDPPLTPIRDVARIASSIENYQKIIDIVPSQVSGIGLCQGNFTLMTDDLPGAIRHFGEQNKIFFVHFRDVRGTRENFHEVFHDDGQTDLVACMRAYRDIGYEGVCRPDHYPKMGDEDFSDDHGLARLFAVGYLKGLREAVHAE